MQAVTTFVCNECGSSTRNGKCVGCGVDVADRIARGVLKRAYDAKPRRVRRANRALPYTERPAEIVELLEWSGVDLTKVRSFIDVGCGANILHDVVKAKYPQIEVVGYDQFQLEGRGQIHKIDLENAKLPYKNGEVDVAVCSHVLEHIDNAHSLTDELLRVAKNVVVLLPNSILWTTVAKVALRRSLAPMVGLPLEKPIDRHRWVYTVGEATRWMRHVAGKYGRNLDVMYRTDWRFPTMMARLNPDLFVLEVSFVLTETPHARYAPPEARPAHGTA
jgi:SAM-dependent methyltransferase